MAEALKQLTTDPASLVPSGAPTGIKAQAAQAVPPGASVTALPKTWRPDGIGGGVMTVVIGAPGQPPVSYAAVVIQEGGRWKVLATLKMQTAATPSTRVS